MSEPDKGASRQHKHANHNVEDVAVSVALTATMGLPVVEAVTRKFLGMGIATSVVIVQHLTLIVGMLGAAIAARENRLLTLSTLGGQLHGRWRGPVAIFAAAWAAAISFLFFGAGVQFVVAEKPAELILTGNIP